MKKKGSINKRRGAGKILLATTLAGSAATSAMTQSTSASASLFDFFKNKKSSLTNGLSKVANYAGIVSNTILSSIGWSVSKLIDKLNMIDNKSNNKVNDKNASNTENVDNIKDNSNTETVNQNIEENDIKRENLNENSNNNKDDNTGKNFSNENLDIEKVESENSGLNDEENGKKDVEEDDKEDNKEKDNEEYEEDDENDKEKTAAESILDELDDDKSLAKQLNQKAFFSISGELRERYSEFAKINENINILWNGLEAALDARQNSDNDKFNEIKEEVGNTKEKIKKLIEDLLKKLEKIKSQSDELSKIYKIYENLLSAFNNNRGAPKPETYVDFYVEINNALKGEEYQINKDTFLKGLKEKFSNNLLGKRFKNVK